jgi:hypothetical protein
MLRSIWTRIFGHSPNSETGDPSLHNAEIAEPTTVVYASFEPDLLSETADQGPPAVTSRDSSVFRISVLTSPIRSEADKRLFKNRLREVRFSRLFTDMTSTEARVLFNIHRRTIRALAAESPAALLRDMRRFAVSSRGQRILSGAEVPDISLVRSWVNQAKARATVLGNRAAKRVFKLTA